MTVLNIRASQAQQQLMLVQKSSWQSVQMLRCYNLNQSGYLLNASVKQVPSCCSELENIVKSALQTAFIA